MGCKLSVCGCFVNAVGDVGVEAQALAEEAEAQRRRDWRMKLEAIGGFVPQDTEPMDIKYVKIHGFDEQMYPIVTIDPQHNAEYHRERVSQYVPKMAKGFDRLMLDEDWKNLKPNVPTDEELYDHITGGVCAYYVKDNTEIGMSKFAQYDYRFDLTQWDHTPYWANTYIDARKVYLDAKTKEMAIVFKNGECVEKKHGKLWDVAKTRLSGCLTHFEVFYGHNWVHFYLADIICATTFSTIPRHSLLYKLLYPHMRYVIETNHAGQDGFSTSVSNGSFEDDFGWWKQGNLDVNTFQESTRARSMTFYLEKITQFSQDYHELKISMDFPYKGLEKSPIPYLHKMYKFYPVIREFVATVAAQFEPEQQDNLDNWKYTIMKHLGKRMRDKALNIDVIDIITTFIWQSSLMHSIDHHTTAKFSLKTQSPLIFRKPFSDTNAEDESYWHPWDIGKNINFMKAIVQYTPTTTNDTFENLQYDFKEGHFNKAADEMKKQVTELLLSQFDIHPSQVAQSISF